MDDNEKIENDVLNNIEEVNDSLNIGKVLLAVTGLAVTAVGGLFIYKKCRKKKEIVITSNFEKENDNEITENVKNED